MDLSFFTNFFPKSLSIFTPKNRGFWGVKPGPSKSPIIQLMAHQKILGGYYSKKMNIQFNLLKKWFIPYYEMEQNCKFIVKVTSFIIQRFLNQSGWDLVWVNIYLGCFDTPNLIPIGWDMAEFWGFGRLTRRERACK